MSMERRLATSKCEPPTTWGIPKPNRTVGSATALPRRMVVLADHLKFGRPTSGTTRRCVHHARQFQRGAPTPYGGTVALAKARARWTYPSRHVSDHEGQFGERVGETSRRSHIGPEVVEAPAEVLDEGVPADDHPRSSVTFQPSHWSKALLETPVVGLERIVRMGLRVVEGRQEQLIEDARGLLHWLKGGRDGAIQR